MFCDILLIQISIREDYALIILFFLCFLILFWKIKKRPAASTPLAPSVTTSINGVFVLLVMISHFYQYAGSYLTSDFDMLYKSARYILGQGVVATFLFFSGYGMMEQMQKKKRAYARRILLDRLPKVLLHFDIAIFLFFLMGLGFGHTETPMSMIKALLGWSKLSVGNSNWFIFTTLCLYVIVFIAFFFYREKPLPCLLATTALTFGYVFLMVHSENNISRFYNTVFCFVIGMWFSYLKEPFYRFVRKHIACYLMAMVACVGIGVGAYILCRGKDTTFYHLLYNLYALAIAFFFVLLAEKFSFGNPILLWLGKHTFPVYILQRIPYILFKEWGLLEFNLPLYFIACVVCTLLFAYLFNRFTEWLDGLIWKKKAK